MEINLRTITESPEQLQYFQLPKSYSRIRQTQCINAVKRGKTEVLNKGKTTALMETTATQMQTNSESTVSPWIPKHTTGLYSVCRILSHIPCYEASHMAVQIMKLMFIYALTKRTVRTGINGSS